MSKPVIRVKGLSKQYRIGQARRNTLRDHLAGSLAALFRRRRSAASSHAGASTFWALKDVSLEVDQGDVVGVIGRNGAGKSTLLKILSRITEPTAGAAEIHGRVASLLEVGTGFHGELSGRENIYLNGAILGMKKNEIKRKFDEIVAFSEIEGFIDTPVKHYSSGMYVRLAFAVAAHLEPEILIVDEVLAVGDAAFQKKCLGRMEDVAKEGRTVMFVSHNMASVEHLCQKAFVLDKGALVFRGESREAIDYYLHSVAGDAHAARSHVIDLSTAPGRSRKYRPILTRLELFTDGGTPLNGSLKIGASLKARVHFGLPTPTTAFDVSLGFDNHHGQRVFTASTAYDPQQSRPTRAGEQVMVCEIPSLPLAPGEYRIKVLLDAPDHRDRVEDAARFTIAGTDYYGTGRVPTDCVFVLRHHWHSADGNST